MSDLKKKLKCKMNLLKDRIDLKTGRTSVGRLLQSCVMAALLYVIDNSFICVSMSYSRVRVLLLPGI